MTEPDQTRGESRLPVLITLLVAMALPFLMPDALLPGPRWLFPLIIGALMVGEIAVDPGRIDRRSRQAHWFRLGLVGVLLVTSVWSTVVLADALIYGQSDFTETAAQLLRSGALVWVLVVIAFTFLYWELDAGGPGERAHVERRRVDLAFPQDLNPEVTPPGWRPTFVDYLYVGITNGSAFSPTDTMPLTHWAKLSMAIQSLTSLVILGLVVARAVNILN
jgi:uncharacterized membrane protein